MDVRVAQDEDYGWHVVVVEMGASEAIELADYLHPTPADAPLAWLRLAVKLRQAATNARGGVTGPVE